jgi:hypothetical protein
MKADWVGYLLRKKCLLKHVVEGKIEENVTVRGQQLPDDRNRLTPNDL